MPSMSKSQDRKFRKAHTPDPLQTISASPSTSQTATTAATVAQITLSIQLLEVIDLPRYIPAHLALLLVIWRF